MGRQGLYALVLLLGYTEWVSAMILTNPFAAGSGLVKCNTQDDCSAGQCCLEIPANVVFPSFGRRQDTSVDDPVHDDPFQGVLDLFNTSLGAVDLNQLDLSHLTLDELHTLNNMVDNFNNPHYNNPDDYPAHQAADHLSKLHNNNQESKDKIQAWIAKHHGGGAKDSAAKSSNGVCRPFGMVGDVCSSQPTAVRCPCGSSLKCEYRQAANDLNGWMGGGAHDYRCTA